MYTIYCPFFRRVVDDLGYLAGETEVSGDQVFGLDLTATRLEIWLLKASPTYNFQEQLTEVVTAKESDGRMEDWDPSATKHEIVQMGRETWPPKGAQMYIPQEQLAEVVWLRRGEKTGMHRDFGSTFYSSFAPQTHWLLGQEHSSEGRY